MTLIERLEAKTGQYRRTQFAHSLINPDGPEAAALLKRYEGALRDISGPVVNMDVAKAVARVALGLDGAQ